MRLNPDKRLRYVGLALMVTGAVEAALGLALLFGIFRPAHAAERLAKPPLVVVVFENHNYTQIAGKAPYLNSLAAKGTLFTNYYAVSHPSLPNYLAMTGGSTFGCTSDSCAQTIAANNVFNQVGDWAGYNESMPSNCYRGNSGLYAAKHNPALFYTDLRTMCAARDVKVLPNPLPALTFYTPNLCNDMHNCSVSTGDTWAKNHIPGLLASGARVIVTFDEGTGNHLYTFEVGPGIGPGTNGTKFTHYGLLAGIESYFGLAKLKAAQTATPVPLP